MRLQESRLSIREKISIPRADTTAEVGRPSPAPTKQGIKGRAVSTASDDDARMMSCFPHSDQGSLSTSTVFKLRLEIAAIAISMDGRGRWLNKVFVELR